MGCNCNQSTNYNLCNPAPCVEQDCSCPTILKTDCVTYAGNDLECSGVVAGQTLTETIEQLDTFICEKVEDITNALTLKNIGDGAKVYKGDDLLGRKELRTVTKTGNLVTVTENTNDIAVSIDETALDTFIEENQLTSESNQLDELNANIYKDTTVVDDVSTFNFRSLIVSSEEGDGQSIVRDVLENANDVTIRLKKLKSDTLTITSTEEELVIESPETASIPALYVNNLYVPTEAEFLAGNTKGEGTLAKPFTDTITAYVLGVPTITPNTALQNALDAYVGDTDFYSRLNPELSGQKIIVQDKGGSAHTFDGDLNYSNLNLKLDGDLYCTISDYIVDMDNATYFNSENSRVTIDIAEGKLLQYDNSLGFRNSGNTSVAPPSFDSGRVLEIKGEGTVFCFYNGAENLTRYILNTDGNNNDDNLHFSISCKLRADHQGVYFIKNKGRVDFYNTLQSGTFLGTINTSIKAFRQTGGQVRFFEKGSVYISSETSGRDYGFTFEPLDNGDGYCVFILNSATVAGNCNWLFARLNNKPVSFLAFNSASNYGFSTTLPGDLVPVNGLFENLGADKWGVEFKNNIFSYTGIDFDKVDLTQGNNISSINFIGNNIVESLVVHSSKENAKLAGLPPNSVFLKRNIYDAVDLIAGVEYKVVTEGVPSLGTVGSFFTATGSETSTGTASLETREILA